MAAAAAAAAAAAVAAAIAATAAAADDELPQEEVEADALEAIVADATAGRTEEEEHDYVEDDDVITFAFKLLAVVEELIE